MPNPKNSPQGKHQPPVPARNATLIVGDAHTATQPASRIPDNPLPSVLGRYRVLQELGHGGMGAVYLAEDTVLTRKVALKVPRFESHKRDQMQARFIREAQLAAQLSHPHICQIFDVAVIDGYHVMAMEYIEGQTLAEYARTATPMDSQLSATLVQKVALAVEAAHLKGLVHRDLKPQNIMLLLPNAVRTSIEPKVMDFGLAKSLDTRADLTLSGMVLGTPRYMSKEQWAGKDGNLGPAADVYSLGVVLYELLTGAFPFDEEPGEPATAWFAKLLTQPQISPSQRQPGIDAGLEAIVMKSIAREVPDRYRSMADFAAALDGWLNTRIQPMANPASGVVFDSEMRSLIALPKAPPPRPLRSSPISKRILWGGAGAIMLVIAIAIGLLSDFGGGSDLTQSEPSEPAITAPAAASPAANAGRTPQTPPVELSSNTISSASDSAALPPVVVPETPTSAPSEREDTHAISHATEAATIPDPTAPDRAMANNVPPEQLVVDSPAPVLGEPLQPITVGTRAGESFDTLLTDGVKMTFLWCPPGTFTMGSPGGVKNEQPVEVTFKNGFWLGQHEVTQEQWTTVVSLASWQAIIYFDRINYFKSSSFYYGRNVHAPWEARDGDSSRAKVGADFPAVGADWNAAQIFCNVLNQIDDRRNVSKHKWVYCLPTEAQWEYACRSGTRTSFSYGEDDSLLHEYAWCKLKKLGIQDAEPAPVSENYAHTVGAKKPNEWGFFDMHGNVHEWCIDEYQEVPSGATVPTNVGFSQVDNDSFVVARGGDFDTPPVGCRSAYRKKLRPNDRSDTTGFRVALIQVPTSK